MKKILTFIAAAVFVIYPSVSFSSYIIHLKDGREFATDRYYEEGDQIKFKRYGGVIGIRKELVKEIEEIEEVEELPAKKEKAVEPEPTAAGAKTGKEEKTEEGAAKAEGSKQEGAEEAKKTEEKEQAKENEKPEEVSEEEKKKAEQEKAAKIEAFLEEKRRILAEKRIIYLKYKEAKAQKDSEEKQRLRRALLQIQKKLSNLRDSVKADYQGKLPTWWDRVK